MQGRQARDRRVGADDDRAPLRFARAHSTASAGSSLDFEAVFHVPDPPYDRFMDAQQAVNLASVRNFSARDVGFAFPAQTLHVASLAREGATHPAS